MIINIIDLRVQQLIPLSIDSTIYLLYSMPNGNTYIIITDTGTYLLKTSLNFYLKFIEIRNYYLSL